MFFFRRKFRTHLPEWGGISKLPDASVFWRIFWKYVTIEDKQTVGSGFGNRCMNALIDLVISHLMTHEKQFFIWNVWGSPANRQVRTKKSWRCPRKNYEITVPVQIENPCRSRIEQNNKRSTGRTTTRPQELYALHPLDLEQRELHGKLLLKYRYSSCSRIFCFLFLFSKYYMFPES